MNYIHYTRILIKGHEIIHGTIQMTIKIEAQLFKVLTSLVLWTKTMNRTEKNE